MGFWYWAPVAGLFPVAFTVAIVRLVMDVIADGVR
jgi:hypothetical protein